MKKICVYTCITGNYDNLNEIRNKEKNVDYLLFTNNKDLKSDTWKIIYIEDSNLDNQRLSRKIKILGDSYIDKNYDISVWMDASVIFDKSITLFVDTYLKHNSFAAFKHHKRDCIYEEAIECIRLRKDDKSVVLKHIEYLKSKNYPKNNGLYEMTVFIKRHNDKTVKKTMELWFDMICNHSKRDQLSFMYCAWLTGLKIDTINLNVWDNEWFHCKKHNYKKELSNCKVYFENNEDYDFNRDIEVKYTKKIENYSFETIVPDDATSIILELTDVPCICYNNIKIKGLKKYKIEYYNSIKVENQTLFYNEHGIIKLLGNFKKGTQLEVSIDMHILNDFEIYELFEKISISNLLMNCTLSENKEKIEKLSAENQLMKKEINNILNSKSWKITKPVRGITNLLKK